MYRAEGATFAIDLGQGQQHLLDLVLWFKDRGGEGAVGIACPCTARLVSACGAAVGLPVPILHVEENGQCLGQTALGLVRTLALNDDTFRYATATGGFAFHEIAALPDPTAEGGWRLYDAALRLQDSPRPTLRPLGQPVLVAGMPLGDGVRLAMRCRRTAPVPSTAWPRTRRRPQHRTTRCCRRSSRP